MQVTIPPSALRPAVAIRSTSYSEPTSSCYSRPQQWLVSMLFLLAATMSAGQVQAQTCNQTSTVNYATVTTTGSRKTSTDAVSGTALTYSGYTSLGNQTNTFQVTNTNGDLNGQILSWNVDHKGSTLANQSISVILTFDRAVDNLTLKFTDLDYGDQGTNTAPGLNGAGGVITGTGADWQDNVKIEPYATTTTTGTSLTLAATDFTTSTSNKYVGSNTVQGVAGSTQTQTVGNMTVVMPYSVRAVRFNLLQYPCDC